MTQRRTAGKKDEELEPTKHIDKEKLNQHKIHHKKNNLIKVMNNIESMKMSTNPRLLKDVLTLYKSTFFALKELIDNSIQAKAKRVVIDLTPSSCGEDDVHYHRIESIEIKDDGEGVPFSRFKNSIMQIATEDKIEGQGVGRFGALQLGREMRIETVAFDKTISKNTRTAVTMTADNIQSSKDLDKVEFPVEKEVLERDCNSSYTVKITDLYQNTGDKIKKKNKLGDEFASDENFKQALFENYTFDIFEKKIVFVVNGEELEREQFLLDTPKRVVKEIECSDGKIHQLNMYFYKVNLKSADINIFFQVNNGGVMQSIGRYAYISPWHTSDAGAWYILIDSDLITTEMMADFVLADFGGDSKVIQQAIKDAIDDFFREGNRKFVSFVDRLKADKNYPYNRITQHSSLEESLFNHTAYILELDQKLIENNSPARGIIYLMVRKLIEDGNVEFLYNEILKLSDESREKFKDLLRITDMDDVVEFSSSVATRTSFLNFLHDLCYGDISNWLKERSQLHKIVEKQLWIFGEEYTDSTRLWSDKKLENNLEELHKKYLLYEPSEEDANLIDRYKDTIKDITDLFFYNKKKTGHNREEVFIVELKAPSCAISEKEIQQIERYRNDIVASSAYPKDRVSYKILLISSEITDTTRIKLEGVTTWLDKDTRFLYSSYNQHGYDIKLYIMEWGELIELNKMKLAYLSESLNVKPEDVGEKFEREYPQLLDEKSRNRLNQRALK